MIEQLLSPELVRALGWTLVHTLWQAALFALLLGLLLVLLRKYSARARYYVCLGVLAAFFVATAATFARQYAPPAAAATPTNATTATATEEADSPAAVIPPAAADGTTSTAPARRATPTPLPALRERFRAYFGHHLPLIVTLWLLGVVVLQLRFLGQLAYLQRLKSYGSERLPARWTEMFRELEDRLDVRRPVRYLSSFRIDSPCTVGWLRPVILLPARMVEALTEPELRTIMAHELAHVKRYDFGVNLLQTLLCLLFFYHPAVWWMAARTEEEREHCCDDLAVAATGERVGYARTLLRLQESTPAAAPLAMAVLGRGGFQWRIRRLLSGYLGTGTYGEGFTTAVIIAGFMALAVNLSGMDTGAAAGAVPPAESGSPALSTAPGRATDDLTAQMTAQLTDSITESLTEALTARLAETNFTPSPRAAEDPFDLLMRAIFAGETEMVSYLLDRERIDLNRLGDHDFTPLMAAASDNNVDIIRLLVVRGVDVNFVNPQGWSALTEAADEGSYEAAEALLAAGADPNPRTGGYGRTPLGMAASEGHPRMIQLLVRAGADVFGAANGAHPLHLAAEEGQLATVRLLLELGADVNATDEDGRTALSYAAGEDEGKVVEFLLRAGANPHLGDARGLTPLEHAAEEGAEAAFDALGSSDHGFGSARGSTVSLLRAAREGELAIVRRLVDGGLDVNAVDADGNSALSLAAREGELAVAEFLLDRGARADGPRDAGGCTPLFLAARESEPGLIRLLTANGASLENGCNFQNIDHRNGKAGGETTISHYEGAPPLIVALEEGSAEATQALIRAGADPNSTCHKRHYRLAESFNYPTANRLDDDELRRRATYTYEADGWTPLLEATAAGRPDLVRQLLAAGARRDHATRQGLTALALARELGHAGVVRLLE